uniref:Uncharacterized protein n=1 Tax=Nelumbo nucifera TaxID=4432 RepID=A0A822ZZS9_NELNU|nr:TPA_asm: hypothetical protein HUJ06_018802 [Nelumbo nucifera]
MTSVWAVWLLTWASVRARAFAETGFGQFKTTEEPELITEPGSSALKGVPWNPKVLFGKSANRVLRSKKRAGQGVKLIISDVAVEVEVATDKPTIRIISTDHSDSDRLNHPVFEGVKVASLR